MRIGLEGLVILTTSVIIGYLAYNSYMERGLDKIKSTVDDREYIVQNNKEDAQGAADLIANIRKKIVLLVEHLKKSGGNDDDSRITLLKENFNPNSFKEGVDDPNYTSYSINKGEQIILCLRNKNELMDINTMMFVVLHELAHIVTNEIGHTPLFWSNFKWILEEAINTGIYIKQDFDKEPVEYCGMTITSSPLDDASL